MICIGFDVSEFIRLQGIERGGQCCSILRRGTVLCPASQVRNASAHVPHSSVYSAPLRSSFKSGANPGSGTWRGFARRHRTLISPVDGEYPFESSPKSLYTLADSKFSRVGMSIAASFTFFAVIGLPSLKKLAYQQILTSLTPSNILQEISSPFTFKYDEI